MTNTAKKNKKKGKKVGPNYKKFKAGTVAPPKENPFENIWARRKFDILGKKRKGEQVRSGLSRSVAIEKRNKTLLKEYEQSGKSSLFVDKRIGEGNDELGEFDKAIMRSQRERQLKLKSKKSKYNLSDEEEDGFGDEGLGHYTERDDFDDGFLSDDDNGDNVRTSKRSAAPVDWEAMDGEGNRPKTQKQIYKEVIMKSKFFKEQRAEDKEKNEQLVEELDKNFTSLSGALSSMTEPGKMNALKALVNKEIPTEHMKQNKFLVAQKLDNDQEDDNYHKLVYEVATDRRVQASERTKTAEEIAQIEREQLEKLEEERQKRMRGVDDFSDDEEDNTNKSSVQRPKSASGDDLGDSFSLGEEPRERKGWVDEILERRDMEGDDDENDDSSEDSPNSGDDDDDEEEDEEGINEDSDSNVSDEKRDKTLLLKDWEQSDDENLEPDLKEDEEDDNLELELEGNEDEDNSRDDKHETDHLVQKKSKKTESKTIENLDGKKESRIRKHYPTVEDIPHVIEAPSNMEDLSALLDNHSNANALVIIDRIRKSNAISLKAENRKKIQVFYGVLLQYFAILANKKPLNYELLNLLVKPLMEMSVEIPYFSAICARQRISRTRTLFCEAIKNPENGCWPSMKTLSLLRLWSMIFPCSDFRHAVMTPALLLMSEYLIRCRLLSGRDVAIGSFLCSMVLCVSRQSHKFCPEAIMFLQTLLTATMEGLPPSYQESQFLNLMELKALRPLLCIRDQVNEVVPLNFLTVIDMPEDSPFFSSDGFRASVLVTVIETLRGFIDIYKGLNSFPEMFLPISTLLLEAAKQENMPQILQDKFKDVAQLINKKADEHHMIRRPLQMRKQKPEPLKLLNPKFEENFVKGRDYDPDREKAERKKLRKLVNKEAKGAIRELRKDNHFIFGLKEKEKARMEEERAEKYGRAKAFLQEQENAAKSGQLGKNSKKRRK